MGLGGRLALGFAALAAAIAVLVGGASVVTAQGQVTGEVDRFLRDRAHEIAQGQRAQPVAGGRRGDAPVVLAVEPDAQVQVLDEDGVLTAASGDVPLPIGDVDIRLAREDRRDVLRTVAIEGEDHRLITSHIPGGGAVQVARSLAESTSVVDVLRSRLVLVAGGLGILAGALGWFVASRTTRPLRRLAGAVDSVADTGDLTVEVDRSGRDEVARLSRGFGRMLDALRTSREQQHRLVHDAAHELRTPLTSIRANVDWLARAETTDPSERHDALAAVQRELLDLQHSIEEIVDLATDRVDRPEHRVIDLADVAVAAADRAAGRTGRTITTDVAPCAVAGDPQRLGRAIDNLLGNADKYSPPGEPIDLDVADGVVLVRDRGPGVPEDERARIFDRFYRGDRHRGRPGTGLGLSIVASIVEEHGGTTIVGDGADGGLCIGFRLPVLRGSSPSYSPGEGPAVS